MLVKCVKNDPFYNLVMFQKCFKNEYKMIQIIFKNALCLYSQPAEKSWVGVQKTKICFINALKLFQKCM